MYGRENPLVGDDFECIISLQTLQQEERFGQFRKLNPGDRVGRSEAICELALSARGFMIRTDAAQ